MPKVKTDYVFIQIPEDLRYRPRYWSPELAYEMTELQLDGSSITHIDWASYRVNHNVILAEIEKYNYDAIILWGGAETYRYIKQIRDKIPEFRVGGMPKDIAKKLDLETYRDITQHFSQTLPDPYLNFFDKDYFNESRLPFTGETTLWSQRVPQKFRFKKKIKPKDAAVISRQTKIKWWYDSVDWLDDVTEDKKWSEEYLKEIGMMDVGFQYTCKGDIKNIDPFFLKLLRETGCKVIDFGQIMVSHLLKSEVFLRLQGACVEAKKHHIFPSFTFVIDKDTTFDACREATKFLLSVDGEHRPLIHKPYGWAKDEEEILQMNNDKYNPTEWDWVTLLGVQSAMEKGMKDAF